MSSLQVHERDDSGRDDAPDAKRQRVDQQDQIDPSKLKILLKDHKKSFIVDRQTAIDNSRYIERAMSGPWANARTGTIELQRSDYATPTTVGLLKEYLEYLEEIADDSESEAEDPLNELQEFGSLANFWLLGDFLQSRTITKAVMEEFEEKSEEIELLDEDMFNAWWAVLENQPAFDKLRGMMLALFVASEAFQEKESRHAMMAALSPAAQEAIVDELMRQHKDVHDEVRDGARELDEYIDDAEGVEVLTKLRQRVDKKVVAEDFLKTY